MSFARTSLLDRDGDQRDSRARRRSCVLFPAKTTPVCSYIKLFPELSQPWSRLPMVFLVFVSLLFTLSFVSPCHRVDRGAVLYECAVIVRWAATTEATWISTNSPYRNRSFLDAEDLFPPIYTLVQLRVFCFTISSIFDTAAPLHKLTMFNRGGFYSPCPPWFFPWYTNYEVYFILPVGTVLMVS